MGIVWIIIKGMKIMIAAALTLAVFAAWHVPILKKKKGIILVLYALGMILFFAVYNIRTLDHIIQFYRPASQTVYQKEYLKTGEYTDAFLDEFLNGRTVYTPNDAFNEATADVDADALGYYWLYGYFHAVNMWNYLEFNGASIVKDDSLNGVTISEEQKSYFEDLGAANDLLRYTFPLTKFDEEWGNGYFYYWFYNYHIGDSRIYVCPEGLKDASSLVLIWQDTTFDTEDYYIASKEYYDKVISK